jgi:hypothetical protein
MNENVRVSLKGLCYCLRDDAMRWLCSPFSPDAVEARGEQLMYYLECDSAKQAELLRMNECARFCLNGLCCCFRDDARR